MGYAKKINEEQLGVLTPILVKMEELEDGESLVLKDSSDALDKLRGLLYNWLHISKQKQYYKVKRDGMEVMRVLRVVKVAPEMLKEGKSVKGKGSEFVKDCLLLVNDETVAKELISSKEAGLTGEEQDEAEKEWRRIQG